MFVGDSRKFMLVKIDAHENFPLNCMVSTMYVYTKLIKIMGAYVLQDCFFFFFFLVNSVRLLKNKTMLDPIAKKLMLRVSNRIKKKERQDQIHKWSLRELLNRLRLSNSTIFCAAEKS